MVHQVRWRGPISDQLPFDDGGIVVRNGPDTFDVIDAAALLALGAGQPGQIIRADSTSPIGFSWVYPCLLYTSPSPRDGLLSRMPSSA